MDAESKDVAELVSDKWEEIGLPNALTFATCHERATGGAAVFLGADDGATDLAAPLNLERLRSFEFVTALEQQDLTPEYYYADLRKPRYGETALWRVQPMIPGQSEKPVIIPNMLVHESRLLIFPGIRTSRRAQLGQMLDQRHLLII